MRKLIVVIGAILCFLCINAQDSSLVNQQSFYFPHPSLKKWAFSIGIIATTMPYEITEELHYRIPAGDLHVLHRLSPRVYLDGRINFQVVQNAITLGPRYVGQLTKRVSFSVGDDVGYWFGFLNLQGFKTIGHGWQNNPNVSLGYQFNKKVLLTLRADGLMVLDIKTYAGNIPVTTNYKTLSGSSYALILEQPFYGKKILTLGFRAIYTSFFWQTWAAFTSFNRSFFYPQLIVGINL